MKLYDFELSGNCYKVRLFLSLLGLEWERELVALGTQNKTPEFRQLSPLGLVPVLVDGEAVIWDSQAILVHLARGREEWLPLQELAAVVSWLSLASNEIGSGPAGLRRIHLFGRQEGEAPARSLTEKVFSVLEEHLSSRDWLVGSRATIADLACYPYLALVSDGKFDVSPYTAVLRWFGRIEGLPDYLPLPGQGIASRS